MPVAVLRRRGPRRTVGTPLRGLSRPTYPSNSLRHRYRGGGWREECVSRLRAAIQRILLPRREIAWLAADPKRAERQPRLKIDSQRASIFSPQAKMIIVALPKQTIAWAATGAPMQLAYNQKTPTEPRTSATPRNKRNDK